MSWPTIFQDAVTDWKADQNGTELGVFRWDPVNLKGYRRVKADSSNYTFAVKNVIYRKGVGTGNGNVVENALANSILGRVAGVCVAANSTASYYGWVQTVGEATVLISDAATIAVHDRMVASTATVGVVTVIPVPTTFGVQKTVLGFAIGAGTVTAATGSVRVYLFID